MVHADYTRRSLIELIIDERDEMEDIRRRVVHSHACEQQGCGTALSNGQFYAVANGDGIRIISRFVMNMISSLIMTCCFLLVGFVVLFITAASGKNAAMCRLD